MREQEQSAGAGQNEREPAPAVCSCLLFLSAPASCLLSTNGTLLHVLRPVLRQQPAQVRIVARGRITSPTDLVNRVAHMAETEMLLQLHDHRYLITLPATRHPPTRVRIDEHSASLIEMILN